MRWGRTPRQFVELFDDALSHLLAASEDVVILDVLVHTHCYGRPACAWAYAEIAEKCAGRNDIWITTRGRIDATIYPRSSWTDELQAGLVRASRVTDFSMHLNFWLSRSAAPSTHAAEAVGTVLEKIVADTAPAILNKV